MKNGGAGYVVGWLKRRTPGGWASTGGVRGLVGGHVTGPVHFAKAPLVWRTCGRAWQQTTAPRTSNHVAADQKNKTRRGQGLCLVPNSSKFFKLSIILKSHRNIKYSK